MKKGVLCKSISYKETGEIPGMHISGSGETGMISEISIAMKLESTIEAFADTIQPHSTVSEIILETVDDMEGCCIHKPKRLTHPANKISSI